MNYAAKIKHNSSSNFMFIAIVLMFAYLCMRGCQSAEVKNTLLTQTVAQKNDTIQAVQKQVDSVVKQKDFASDQATTTARVNQQLTQENDSLKSVQPVASDLTLPAPKKPDSSEYWKAKYYAAASDNDFLRMSLASFQPSANKKDLSHAKDSVKTKAKPTTQFAFGSDMSLPDDGDKPNYVLSFSGTSAYSAARSVITIGAGLDLANRDNTQRLDAYLSRDLIGNNKTNRLRFVLAYHKDFAKIYKFNKKK